MSKSRVRVLTILVDLGMRGVILSILFLHSVTAREIGNAATNERDAQEAAVLKTQQAKLIRSLFRASEEVHLEALKVKDRKTFTDYSNRLVELEKRIRTILGELKREAPLSRREQAELRSLLKDEEVRIGNAVEEASLHTTGLRNVLLGQEMQKLQKEFTERLTPLVTEQSNRHYKPPKKEQK